ncbi:glutathione S-transferase family protein [Nitratireductor basaltis]|uniref:Glutathione S-transferase n=1 Tax=Nitratireductor basaltis TaxID=472175 RepID=A0A084U9B4_9HYPH|nr:glutathione S-transferase family protein [Nitratireductor basaltis]KFB09550.1 Glutathione S-transferase [Nitratireductor basaltis]
MKLYHMPDSGNSYKPRLLMAKLGIDCELIAVSSRDGSTRKPDFLARNPIGKVPLLELDAGRYLAESNAILLYLAEGSRYMPKDRYQRALVAQWLFFEQYSHEPNIAVRRALKVYEERHVLATPQRLQETLEGGNHALGVMEQRLRQGAFLVGDEMSVADISLYAYTHDAERGEFDLELFPAVQDWLKRVRQDAGHIPMT